MKVLNLHLKNDINMSEKTPGLLGSISDQLALLQLLTKSGPVPKTFKLFYEQSKKLGFNDLIISKTWKRTNQKENKIKKKTRRKDHVLNNTPIQKSTDSDSIYISDSDDELSSPVVISKHTTQSKLISETRSSNFLQLNKVDVSNASYTLRLDCSKFEISKISDSMCLLRSSVISPMYHREALSDQLSINENKTSLINKNKQVSSDSLLKNKSIINYKAPTRSNRECSIEQFKSISKSDFQKFLKNQKRLEKNEKRKMEDELEEKIRSRIIDVMIPRYCKNVIKC